MLKHEPRYSAYRKHIVFGRKHTFERIPRNIQPQIEKLQTVVFSDYRTPLVARIRRNNISVNRIDTGSDARGTEPPGNDDNVVDVSTNREPQLPFRVARKAEFHTELKPDQPDQPVELGLDARQNQIQDRPRDGSSNGYTTQLM